jgi:hypothetical protein
VHDFNYFSPHTNFSHLTLLLSEPRRNRVPLCPRSVCKIYQLPTEIIHSLVFRLYPWPYFIWSYVSEIGLYLRLQVKKPTQLGQSMDIMAGSISWAQLSRNYVWGRTCFKLSRSLQTLRKIISIYSENHKERIIIFYGRYVELMNIKAGGTYGYYRAVNLAHVQMCSGWLPRLSA